MLWVKLWLFSAKPLIWVKAPQVIHKQVKQPLNYFQFYFRATMGQKRLWAVAVPGNVIRSLQYLSHLCEAHGEHSLQSLPVWRGKNKTNMNNEIIMNAIIHVYKCMPTIFLNEFLSMNVHWLKLISLTPSQSRPLRWEIKWLNTCNKCKTFALCIVLVLKFRRSPVNSAFKVCWGKTFTRHCWYIHRENKIYNNILLVQTLKLFASHIITILLLLWFCL